MAASEKGIVVTTTPGANTVSVAELTLGLMLALARMIPLADASTKAGLWPRMHGVALEGKVIGLLGLGAIGKQVARRLLGFDCSVMAYDPVADAEYARRHAVQLLPSIDDVIGRADFVSLHLPASPATRGMVDATFLGKMKPGAYLLNTARGESDRRGGPAGRLAKRPARGRCARRIRRRAARRSESSAGSAPGYRHAAYGGSHGWGDHGHGLVGAVRLSRRAAGAGSEISG